MTPGIRAIEQQLLIADQNRKSNPYDGFQDTHQAHVAGLNKDLAILIHAHKIDPQKTTAADALAEIPAAYALHDISEKEVVKALQETSL